MRCSYFFFLYLGLHPIEKAFFVKKRSSRIVYLNLGSLSLFRLAKCSDEINHLVHLSSHKKLNCSLLGVFLSTIQRKKNPHL
ncbi:MAG: hypothetical protein HW387_248 [Parachlamydiales bacterium]|nr:hypothetical protein [Parachlamydiales bacterium]